jgi:hypothetical protein
MTKELGRGDSPRTQTRAPSSTVGRSNNRGVFIHEQYNPTDNFANDIALIKLVQPFTATPYLQTVGVPTDPCHSAMVGILASISHTAALPAGQVDICRSPIPASDYQPKIYVTSTSASVSLCPGDSGDGIPTVEYGRAFVRGIASQANTTNCMTSNAEAVSTDVFTHRSPSGEMPSGRGLYGLRRCPCARAINAVCAQEDRALLIDLPPFITPKLR